MTKDIKTTELIRTSQSWDGAMLPDFPQGQPELRVVRLDFPIGAKTGWHHHTVVNYGTRSRNNHPTSESRSATRSQGPNRSANW